MSANVIPEFKRRRTFVCDVESPCLRATLPNSVVPKLAARYIAQHRKDPTFQIFLRGKNPGKKTAWQRAMLKRLLEKGEFASAIEQGMNDYYNQCGEPLTSYEAKDREDMKVNGLLPHFALTDVIIDDLKREVLLLLTTDSDGHLEEHGITIYLKDKRWIFDTDHLYDYIGAVEEEEGQREAVDFEEDEDEPEGTALADPSFLFGVWVFDEAAYRESCKQWRTKDDDIRMAVNCYTGRYIELAPNQLIAGNSLQRLSKPSTGKILSYLHHGEVITIKFRFSDENDDKSWDCVFANDRLTIEGDCIFKRKPAEDEKGEVVEPGVLLGTWVYDEEAHSKALQHRAANEAEIKNAVQLSRGRQIEFSTDQLVVSNPVKRTRSFIGKIRSYRKRENAITITFQYLDEYEERIWKCQCEGDQLTFDDDRIYRRKPG